MSTISGTWRHLYDGYVHGRTYVSNGAGVVEAKPNTNRRWCDLLHVERGRPKTERLTPMIGRMKERGHDEALGQS